MAKGKNKKSEVGTVETVVTPSVTGFEGMSREELKARYEANVARRQELADENKMLSELYKTTGASEKKASAEAKIAALQAKLAALQGGETPVAVEG